MCFVFCVLCFVFCVLCLCVLPQQQSEQAAPGGSLKLARPYYENKSGFMGASEAGQRRCICVIRGYKLLQFRARVFENRRQGIFGYFEGS